MKNLSYIAILGLTGYLFISGAPARADELEGSITVSGAQESTPAPAQENPVVSREAEMPSQAARLEEVMRERDSNVPLQSFRECMAGRDAEFSRRPSLHPTEDVLKICHERFEKAPGDRPDTLIFASPTILSDINNGRNSHSALGALLAGKKKLALESEAIAKKEADDEAIQVCRNYAIRHDMKHFSCKVGAQFEIGQEGSSGNFAGGFWARSLAVLSK